MMKMKRATNIAATSEAKYVIPEHISFLFKYVIPEHISYFCLDYGGPDIEQVIKLLMVTMLILVKML